MSEAADGGRLRPRGDRKFSVPLPFVLLGPQLMGRGPPTLGTAVCFTQSTHSDARTTHRHTQKGRVTSCRGAVRPSPVDTWKHGTTTPGDEKEGTMDTGDATDAAAWMVPCATLREGCRHRNGDAFGFPG